MGYSKGIGLAVTLRMLASGGAYMHGGKKENFFVGHGSMMMAQEMTCQCYLK